MTFPLNLYAGWCGFLAGAWEKCTLFDVTYQPAHLSVDALRTGLLELARRVYRREFTDQRRRQFARRKLARDQRAA